MEEKKYQLELNEQELNVVWQTLMSGTVTGQNAPYVVTVMQKIQASINAANTPAQPVETEKPEEVKEEVKK